MMLPVLAAAMAAHTAALAQEPVLLEAAPEAPAPDEKRSADRDPPRPQLGPLFLRDARKTLNEKGCAAATPAYRAAAALGAGMEAAQHELGECLLEAVGATDAETRLLRDEGLFWLTRAAWAGNARAQRRLALLHASPVGGAHAPLDALKWALVFGKNPEADLFSGPLPATLVDGLVSDLGPAARETADAFAAGFAPLAMPSYAPDLPAAGGGKERRRKGGGDARRRPGR